MRYLKTIFLIVLLTFALFNKAQSEESSWSSLTEQGSKAFEYRDLNTAEKLLEEAYSLAVFNNNKKQIYQSMAKLADLYRDELKYPEAIDFYEKSINIQEELISKGENCLSYQGTKAKLKTLKNKIKNGDFDNINKFGNLDLNSYLRDIEKTIKSNWHPPKNQKYENTVVLFKLTKNGELLSVKIQKSSGNKKVDESVINAVRESSPFSPMPDEHNEYKYYDVNFQMNFDYNVYNP